MFQIDSCRLVSLNAHSAISSEAGLEFTTHSFNIAGGEHEESTMIGWLLQSFPKDEFFQMASTQDFNAKYEEWSELLDSSNDKVAHHRKLAESFVRELMPESSIFFTANVENLLFDDELCNGFLICFPDLPKQYLQNEMMDESGNALIQAGWAMDKIKTGALLIDAFKEDGYRICFKHTGKNDVVHSILKDEIFGAKPLEDPFHYTKNYLSLCSSFVKDRLPENSGISKTEQADILNKSIAYFKNAEAFSEKEFLEEVLPEEDLSSSFQQYKKSYVSQHQIQLSDDFDISIPAVKTQQRVFKSVLKLDKNFHIYIHGDKDLIHKGAESDGRKYYKIYFEEEH